MEGYVRGEEGHCGLMSDTADSIDRMQAFGDALEAFWARGIPEPFTLRDHYLSFLADGDEGCPVLIDGAFSPQDCVSESGTHFYGLAFYQEFDKVQNQPGYLFAMQASFELSRSNEAPFSAGGGFGYEVLAAPNQPTDWMAFVQGSFHYPAASGWLGDGVTSGIAIRGSHHQGTYRFGVEGGSGQDDVYLFWDQVSVDSEQCDGYPTGRIGLRGEDTHWTWWTMAESCDGCGSLEYDDALVGTYCMDLRDELNQIASWMDVL